MKSRNAYPHSVSKYGARTTTRIVAGEEVKFDSRREARRYDELRIMERAGVIRELKRQIPYELIPAQRDGKGRVIERSVRYVADFVYEQQDPDGTWRKVVEDAKGYHTKDYIIKRKLMLYMKGIRIVEV